MHTHQLFNDQPPECPRCSQGRVVAVVYQPPSEEMLTAEKLGLIALGASGDISDSPQWKCQQETCGHLF